MHATLYMCDCLPLFKLKLDFKSLSKMELWWGTHALNKLCEHIVDE